MSAVPVTASRPRAAATWLSERPHVIGLAAILALAAFLDLFRLERNGYANEYYAGAVRSMLESWHNFFFVSFDPGGLVSVDKPPLALWLEAISAKIFGYSGWSILLPEALAGIGAVWLLYLLVARVFGRWAGLAAALALAVSPVSVSVNRDNNPDALLALLLVAAAYVGVRAVDSGRLRTLVLCAVLVGLAFNTKMLAAMVVVPGLALAYAAFAKVPWRRRAVHLVIAGVVLALVSGAWMTAVDLTPATSRPYVGSTSDNSAFSLAFGYNGLGRVTGQTGGTSFGGGGGGLGGAFSGSPGWLRLLNDALGDQGGWLLPLAILGGLSALIAAVRLRRRRELAALTVIGGWFVAAAFVFSFSSGIIHTYYLSALAPATSALVGIGVVALWRDARRHPLWLGLPLLALALCAWLEVDLLRRSDYLSWLQPLVIAGCAVAAVALVVARLPRVPGRLVTTGAVIVGLAALLAAPTAWAATTLKSPVNGVFPGAGPSFVTGLSASGGAGGFGFRGGRRCAARGLPRRASSRRLPGWASRRIPRRTARLSSRVQPRRTTRRSADRRLPGGRHVRRRRRRRAGRLRRRGLRCDLECPRLRQGARPGHPLGADRLERAVGGSRRDQGRVGRRNGRLHRPRDRADQLVPVLARPLGRGPLLPAQRGRRPRLRPVRREQQGDVDDHLDLQEGFLRREYVRLDQLAL